MSYPIIVGQEYMIDLDLVQFAEPAMVDSFGADEPIPSIKILWSAAANRDQTFQQNGEHFLKFKTVEEVAKAWDQLQRDVLSRVWHK